MVVVLFLIAAIATAPLWPYSQGWGDLPFSAAALGLALGVLLYLKKWM
jgi:Protein of unknown function (DUF3309)